MWKLDFQAKEEAEEDEQVSSTFLITEPAVKRDKQDTQQQQEEEDSKPDLLEEEEDLNDDNSVLKVTRVGSVLRSGEGRLVSLVADVSGRLLAAHSIDNNLELFLVCTDKEIQRRLARKAKKERKRTGAEVDPARLVPTVQEQFRRLKSVRAGGKIKSVAVRIVKKSSCRVLMALGKHFFNFFSIGRGLFILLHRWNSNRSSQCCGAGSGRNRNYLQNPDPELLI